VAFLQPGPKGKHAADLEADARRIDERCRRVLRKVAVEQNEQDRQQSGVATEEPADRPVEEDQERQDDHQVDEMRKREVVRHSERLRVQHLDELGDVAVEVAPAKREG
jgi:hypothetical protein